MTCLSRYSIELMANHVIERLNGADLVVYAGGLAYPRHPDHTLARCVVEMCRYRLATPCGVFDDSLGYSRIVFTPPTRLSQQPDVEAYPNLYRIYDTEGACMYQGPARVVDYRYNDTNYIGEDNTLTGILELTPLDRERDSRWVDGGYTDYVWEKIPRWVDINITSLAISFGDAK